MFKILTAAAISLSVPVHAEMFTIFKADESKLSFDGITNKIIHMKLSQIDSKTAKDTVLMFGDSITQGLNQNGLHFEYVNMGIGGDTVHGIKARVKSEELGKYRAIFIESGTNNLLMGESGDLLGDEIAEMIEYAAPKAKKLYVSQIFVPNREKITNIAKDAKLADYKIQLTCAKFQNCVVVPIPVDVIGDDGIKPEYSLADSTHLNGKAYALWKDELNRAMATFPFSLYYKYFK
ncbi:GDSL-type esterase/lipase family protein [Enterobacter ludwigii]|uniref:GDSL-type esterase/lipase family protein n=1 Tax=Enterobacter ludwigii TaxID=299767 RepID=UPI002ACADDF7|nr:GDSL-type esterase/lipase family protein [Enterobacter ludwigii]MDZ5702135.1 GDSL-type esterase/lipase family protein [Enterobacter ludwigii]